MLQGCGFGQVKHVTKVWVGQVKHVTKVWVGQIKHVTKVWVGQVKHVTRLWVGQVNPAAHQSSGVARKLPRTLMDGPRAIAEGDLAIPGKLRSPFHR